MAVQSIKQKIENIDFSPTKTSTYLMFVPGLSLLIQKVQTASILPMPRFTGHFDQVTHDKSTRFAALCKWSLRGSMTQSVICTIAFAIFQSPIFGLLAIAAASQIVYTFLKACQNPVTIWHFKPDGTPGMLITSTPFNLF